MRSSPTVTSCNNRRAVGSCVFYATRAKATEGVDCAFWKPVLLGSQPRTDSGSWRLAVGSQSSRGLAAEAKRSEYEIGVRWSPPYKDVSPEAEELPPLEAAIKQRD
jgi:hypothetical protein